VPWASILRPLIAGCPTLDDKRQLAPEYRSGRRTAAWRGREAERVALSGRWHIAPKPSECGARASDGGAERVGIGRAHPLVGRTAVVEHQVGRRGVAAGCPIRERDRDPTSTASGAGGVLYGMGTSTIPQKSEPQLPLLLAPRGSTRFENPKGSAWPGRVAARRQAGVELGYHVLESANQRRGQPVVLLVKEPRASRARRSPRVGPPRPSLRRATRGGG
jgi:hypothetical protein